MSSRPQPDETTSSTAPTPRTSKAACCSRRHSAGSERGANYQLNREYVTITNTGTTTRTLTGWTVLDLANHVYTFPSFKLGAGKSVRLHTGKGTNTSTDLYWGKGWYVWNSPGDKATSRDSSGALKDTCSWGDGTGIRYC